MKHYLSVCWQVQQCIGRQQTSQVYFLALLHCQYMMTADSCKMLNMATQSIKLQHLLNNNDTLTICIISVNYVEQSHMVFLFQLVLTNRTSNRNSTFILLCQNDESVKKEDVSVRLPTTYNFLQATLCDKPKNNK